MISENKKRISVTIDREYLETFRARAALEGVTLSDFMTIAVLVYIKLIPDAQIKEALKNESEGL